MCQMSSGTHPVSPPRLCLRHGMEGCLPNRACSKTSLSVASHSSVKVLWLEVTSLKKNAIGNGLSCSFSFFRACSREVYYLHRRILGTQYIGCMELAILPKAACPGKIEG